MPHDVKEIKRRIIKKEKCDWLENYVFNK